MSASPPVIPRTRGELAATVRRLNALFLRWQLGAPVLGVLWLLGLAWLLKRLGAQGGPLRSYLWICLSIAGFIGFLVAPHWLKVRHARRLGLICGQCRAVLSDLRGQIAVATGRCGRCGHEVFGSD